MKTKDTRTRILEAALHLFSQNGYLGATTREIAGRAGVAEITLFRHFPTKEKLFGEVVARYSFLPALREMLPELRKMEYRDALSVLAGKFLGRLSERRDLIRIMQSEMAGYPSAVRKIYHGLIGEMFTTLASYFAELQKQGKLRAFQPELAAKAFLGMFFSHFHARELLHTRGKKYEDERTVIQEFVGLFVEGTER
ncbi:MAG: TetR/AcrR family transcriptional regulator [Nitrospirae bacterium]|nr:TetR/AcrR family transcriptional regulator [Nitrospirota bacterium]